MSCSYGGIDGRSGVRQRLILEDIVEVGTFEVRQFNEASVCWSRFQQSDTACLGFVVLKLIEVEEVAGIVTTAKDDVATGGVVTEGTQHFCLFVSSYPRH